MDYSGLHTQVFYIGFLEGGSKTGGVDCGVKENKKKTSRQTVKKIKKKKLTTTVP
jgi:hypothetical protein